MKVSYKILTSSLIARRPYDLIPKREYRYILDIVNGQGYD